MKTINKIYLLYNGEYDIFFGNGGDQSSKNVPENKICKELGVKLIDGLGEKIQSSSWLLNKKQLHSTQKQCKSRYVVIYEMPNRVFSKIYSSVEKKR